MLRFSHLLVCGLLNRVGLRNSVKLETQTHTTQHPRAQTPNLPNSTETLETEAHSPSPTSPKPEPLTKTSKLSFQTHCHKSQAFVRWACSCIRWALALAWATRVEPTRVAWERHNSCVHWTARCRTNSESAFSAFASWARGATHRRQARSGKSFGLRGGSGRPTMDSCIKTTPCTMAPSTVNDRVAATCCMLCFAAFISLSAWGKPRHPLAQPSPKRCWAQASALSACTFSL